jgi:hypothetical protein
MESMISSEDETYERGKGMAKKKVEKKASDVMAQEALKEVIANISNLSSDKLRKIAALKLEDVQNSRQMFKKSDIVEKVKVKRGNTRTVNLKDMAEAIKAASSNNSKSITAMLKIFSDEVRTELEKRRWHGLTPEQKLQDQSLQSVELEEYEPSSISRNSISESISRNSISLEKSDEDKEVDDKLDRMIAKTIAARRHSAPAPFSASAPSVADLEEQLAALEAKLAAIDKEPPPPSSKGSGSMSFTEVDSLKEAFGNWQKKRGSGESLVKLMAALKEKALDGFRLDKTLSEKSVELLDDLKKQANPKQFRLLGEIIKAVKGEEYKLGIADPDQEKAFKKVVGELEPPPPGFEDDDTPTVAAGDASAKALDSVGSPPNFMPLPPSTNPKSMAPKEAPFKPMAAPLTDKRLADVQKDVVAPRNLVNKASAPEAKVDPIAEAFAAWRASKATESGKAFINALNTQAKAQAGEKPDHKVIAEKRQEILAEYRDNLPRFFGSAAKSDLDKIVRTQEGQQNAALLNSLFVGNFDEAKAALETGANTETLKLDGGKIERLKAELVNVGNKLADPSKKQSLFYHKDGGDHTSIRLEAVAGLEPKQRSFLLKYLDTVKNRGARAVVEEMLNNTKKAKAIIDYASGDPEISSVDPDLLASADLRSFSADPTFSLDSMGQSSPSGSRSMSVSSSISDEDPHRRSGAVVKNRSSMSSSVDSYMSQFRISDSGSPSFRASVSRGSVSDSVPRSPSGPESVAIPKNIRYAFAPTEAPVSESQSRSFADTMIQTHQGGGRVKYNEQISPPSGRRESRSRNNQRALN